MSIIILMMRIHIMKKFKGVLFMKKLKVLTVVGTRPEIIRLSCVLNKLNLSPVIDHILVHTGQNYDYELNEIFFADLNLKKPDYFLGAAGNGAVETAGRILISIEPILCKVFSIKTRSKVASLLMYNYVTITASVKSNTRNTN